MIGDKKSSIVKLVWEMLGRAQLGPFFNCRFYYVGVSCLSPKGITGTLSFPNICDTGEPFLGELFEPVSMSPSLEVPSGHQVQASFRDMPFFPSSHLHAPL